MWLHKYLPSDYMHTQSFILIFSKLINGLLQEKVKHFNIIHSIAFLCIWTVKQMEFFHGVFCLRLIYHGSYLLNGYTLEVIPKGKQTFHDIRVMLTLKAYASGGVLRQGSIITFNNFKHFVSWYTWTWYHGFKINYNGVQIL